MEVQEKKSEIKNLFFFVYKSNKWLLGIFALQIAIHFFFFGRRPFCIAAKFQTIL